MNRDASYVKNSEALDKKSYAPDPKPAGKKKPKGKK